MRSPDVVPAIGNGLRLWRLQLVCPYGRFGTDELKVCRSANQRSARRMLRFKMRNIGDEVIVALFVAPPLRPNDRRPIYLVRASGVCL
jgi:hypothetical protein